MGEPSNDSPGEVAKHFNEIAHLDVIDRGLTNVQARIRKLTQSIESNEDLISELEEGLAAFDHLNEFEKKVEALEKKQDKLARMESDWSQLQSVVGDITKTDAKLKEAKKIVKLEEKVNFILGLYQKKKGIQISFGNLKEM